MRFRNETDEICITASSENVRSASDEHARVNPQDAPDSALALGPLGSNADEPQCLLWGPTRKSDRPILTSVLPSTADIR